MRASSLGSLGHRVAIQIAASGIKYPKHSGSLDRHEVVPDLAGFDSAAVLRGQTAE